MEDFLKHNPSYFQVTQPGNSTVHLWNIFRLNLLHVRSTALETYFFSSFSLQNFFSPNFKACVPSSLQCPALIARLREKRWSSWSRVSASDRTWFLSKYSLKLVGFGRACAHPSFWAHFHAKQGAVRPPPPIAASLLLIHSSKIITNYFQ